MFTAFRTALACATLAAVVAPLSASAANESSSMSMSMDKMPCSQAAMAMSSAMKGDAMTKGDAMKDDATTVDGEFKEMAMDQMPKIKHMMSMAKLEMRCGTDAKTKAAAAKTYDDLQRIVTSLNIF